MSPPLPGYILVLAETRLRAIKRRQKKADVDEILVKR